MLTTHTACLHIMATVMNWQTKTECYYFVYNDEREQNVHTDKHELNPHHPLNTFVATIQMCHCEAFVKHQIKYPKHSIYYCAHIKVVREHF